MQRAIELITDKLQSWFEALVANLPNLILAIVVLIAFWIGGRLVAKGLRKLLARLSVTPSISGLLATLAKIVVVVIGLFFALGILQLDKTVTSLLAGAGVIGLVLGFAFQDVASDVLAGMLLAIRKPIVVGDLVESNDAFGVVNEINLRSLVLDTPDGKRVMIPNRNVFTNNLVNLTRRGQRRVDLPVGVSYGEDLERVREVAIAAIEGVPSRDPDREVELFFDQFGASSIDLTVRFWIDFSRQADYLRARSEAVMRIKKAFDDAGISIPFPIRTLDFGIKGGARLDEMLVDRETDGESQEDDSAAADERERLLQ